MLTFETYNGATNMRPCMKKPVVVHALKINEPFRVRSLEGDYAQGNPGDYLMRGIEGEMYIQKAEIFEKAYEWVEVHDLSAANTNTMAR